jgi:hypothetical protein
VLLNANELELNVGQLIDQNVIVWYVLTSMWTILGSFKIFKLHFVKLWWINDISGPHHSMSHDID